MQKVRVIAEAGVNHNGSLDLALELVDAAAKCGADIVKFQTFTAEALVTPQAPRAPYQQVNTKSGGSQFEMLKKLELPKAHHAPLLERCRDRGIQFLSTPFDPASLDFLARELDLALLKLGSSELTNAPLLLEAGRTGKPVILSTGMGTLAEVENALAVLAFGYGSKPGSVPDKSSIELGRNKDVLRDALLDKVTLLHCTTSYPTPADGVNLLAMKSMMDAFGLHVGFSDHTPGIVAASAAVALGATVIEKHITLDTTLPGPDHKASLEPREFKQMVESIRFVEEAMGDGVKQPQECEIPNVPIARKSLVASLNIEKGQKFSATNLTVMRPGTGDSPFRYWDLIGQAASRNYSVGDVISEGQS